MTIKVEQLPGSLFLRGSEKSSYISKRSQETFLCQKRTAVPLVEFGDDNPRSTHNAQDSKRSHSAALPPPDLTDTDDDCESWSSGSNDSCPSDTSSKPTNKRVTFAWPIVTEVRSRPHTLPEDVATLFYSADETQRFRQQYRLERINSRNNNSTVDTMETKNQSTLNFHIEDKTCGSNLLQDLTTSSSTSPSTKSRIRQCIISRVVVMHNNIRDIFVHSDHALMSPISNHDGSVKLVNSSDHYFFDNDNFWNGSLTWFDHASSSGKK